MSYRASFLLIVLLAACASFGVAAQGFDDPTRPPPTLLARNPDSAAPAPVAQAPRLQSVLIAKGAGARHVAVIDGVTVRLGEKFKGARLVQVSETEVVLVQGQHRQVLKMFPATAPGALPPH